MEDGTQSMPPQADEATRLLSETFPSHESTDNNNDDNNNNQESPVTNSTHIATSLYVSHFLSTWNARVLEYGAVLFLAELAPNTFLPLSLYALFRSLSAILFSHKIGAYIDNSERLSVVRNSIVYQRIAVIATCFFLWLMALLVQTPSTPSPTDNLLSLVHSKAPAHIYTTKFNVLLGFLIFFACVERLCATMNMVSVERDWVIIIADSDSNLLRILNARMRRIDLFCKLIGPLAISYLDAWFELTTMVWVLLIWNFVSMFIEYFTIAKVYHSTPMLQAPKVKRTQVATSNGATRNPVVWLYESILKPFGFYLKHPIFLPSFSLSMLYMTVLSFGPQMVAFLLFQGRGPEEVGLLRTVSVVVELATTFFAPWVMKRTGPVKSGLGFAFWQALSLIIALYISFPLLGVNPVGALYLVVGVISSRIGLWGFDLSVQIIIQEGVESENRARFSSMEAAFQSLFELASFVQTIIWSTPEQFKIPALTSTTFTTLAAILYLVYVCLDRHYLKGDISV